MKKRNNIFTIILTTLLVLMSFMAISFYDNANTRDIDRIKDIEYYFSDEFQYTTLGLTMQLDSSYTPLQFSDEVDEGKKEYLKSEFNNQLEDIRSFLHMDKDFFYLAKNTKTQQVVTNIENYDPNTFNLDDYGYTIHVNYDKEGYCTTEGPIALVFSDLEADELFDRYTQFEYEDQFSEALGNDVSVNKPKNVDIYYMFSKDIQSFDGLSGYLNSWEHYNAFSAVIYCIFAAFLILLILFYPIRYVQQANPFKTVKEWSFEINLVTWTSIVSFSFLAILVLAGTTINGQLSYLLSSFGIGYANPLLLVINFVVWYLSLLVVAIGAFLIKYIVTYGPIRYIKDHTLVSKFFAYIKEKLNLISEIELTSPMNTTIMKYVLINGAITIFIAIWNVPLSIVFAIIYTLVLFFYAKKKTQEIQSNYNTLLNSIQNIISEDFDTITEKDFGIFESSKKELSQLSKNFELAIQEKVKSEKMKTELISNVSHDLKTPLTCIKNYLVLLKDDDITLENKHYYLEQLNLYTNRLKNLIEDLFEISKVDSGNINLNIQELDIVSLLNQAYLENEDMLESKDITFIKKSNAEKLVLNLDSDKTYRVFENLLTNIDKYALPGSRAYLTLTELPDQVEIEFSNISEVAMDFTSEEITERFVRGDKSRSKQGSGLGLAIARSFTEAQGGTFKITIDCDLFKVKITFPKNEMSKENRTEQ